MSALTFRIYPRTDGMWGVAVRKRGWFGVSEAPLGNGFAPETFYSKAEAKKRIKHVQRASELV